MIQSTYNRIPSELLYFPSSFRSISISPYTGIYQQHSQLMQQSSCYTSLASQHVLPSRQREPYLDISRSQHKLIRYRFHTAGSHSQTVHKKYNRADCSGIVLLMWGASLASIHFAFICDPRQKSLHWFLVCLRRFPNRFEACTDDIVQSSASATGCITFILGPMFIQPQYRSLRALTYLSLGLFAFVFIVHSIYLHGFALQRRRLSLEWMGLMALLNLLGCSAYAFRVSCCYTCYMFRIMVADTKTQIPESKFPGKFDFVGASHQIMHVAVLAAGLVHYHGLSKALLETRGEMRLAC
jgi:adiponectin receptor